MQARGTALTTPNLRGGPDSTRTCRSLQAAAGATETAPYPARKATVSDGPAARPYVSTRQTLEYEQLPGRGSLGMATNYHSDSLSARTNDEQTKKQAVTMERGQCTNFCGASTTANFAGRRPRGPAGATRGESGT